MTAQLIELDSRRRASLSSLAHADHERYLATVEPDGTIVLTPAVVLTAAEAGLQERPELVEQLEAGSAPGAAFSTQRPARRRRI